MYVFAPSMQNVLPSLALSPEEDTEELVTVQEKEKMINISYELAAEASKRSKLVAGTSLEKRARRWWRASSSRSQLFLCVLSNCSCFHCVCVESFIIAVSFLI